MTLQQLPQPADHRGHLTVLLHDQDGGPFDEPHQLDGMPPYGDIGIRGGLELSIHVISAGYGKQPGVRGLLHLPQSKADGDHLAVLAKQFVVGVDEVLQQGRSEKPLEIAECGALIASRLRMLSHDHGYVHLSAVTEDGDGDRGAGRGGAYGGYHLVDGSDPDTVDGQDDIANLEPSGAVRAVVGHP